MTVVPCSPALCLSISHSPPKQFDFDASQEGVAALNDQPRVACAVHGQPNFGCDVYLHRNIQEANEAGRDHGTKETMSHSRHRSLGILQACQEPVTSGFSTVFFFFIVSRGPSKCYPTTSRQCDKFPLTSANENFKFWKQDLVQTLVCKVTILTL